jgi:Tol biopolymer transport system component
MSRLEDRLRDAYQGAAATVTPGNIRGLGEPAAQTATPPVRLGPVWGRWLTPLAAAAAVAAVAILAAILVSPGPLSPKGASAEPKFLIADVIGARPFEIRDAATGALVAHLTSPARSGRSAVDTTSVATADGRHYVMAVYTTRPCRSRLYQFQLDDRGQPSAVTPLARPAVPGEVYDLAVSGNGQKIAYATIACTGESKPPPPYLAVTNLVTQRTTRWTLPADGPAGSVSLTADGSLLCYSVGQPSVVRIIPAGSAPGPAAALGRTVVRAADVGPHLYISFAVVSPDGGAVYFTTYPYRDGIFSSSGGQVRVQDLATGRSRLVHAPAGKAGVIAADPSARHLLLQIQTHQRLINRQPPLLARLDLATGKVTYLPNGWLGPIGAIIRW